MFGVDEWAELSEATSSACEPVPADCAVIGAAQINAPVLRQMSPLPALPALPLLQASQRLHR